MEGVSVKRRNYYNTPLPQSLPRIIKRVVVIVVMIRIIIPLQIVTMIMMTMMIILLLLLLQMMIPTMRILYWTISMLRVFGCWMKWRVGMSHCQPIPLHLRFVNHPHHHDYIVNHQSQLRVITVARVVVNEISVRINSIPHRPDPSSPKRNSTISVIVSTIVWII